MISDPHCQDLYNFEMYSGVASIAGAFSDFAALSTKSQKRYGRFFGVQYKLGDLYPDRRISGSPNMLGQDLPDMLRNLVACEPLSLLNLKVLSLT